MSLQKNSADLVYNASYCEDHPDIYRRCPDGAICKLRTAQCHKEVTLNPIKIEMAVILSAVALCFAIFIVAVVIYRVKRRQSTDTENPNDQTPGLHGHSFTRLTPIDKLPGHDVKPPEHDTGV